MADAPIDALDHFRQDAALSHGELWLRYFELGGMSTGLELEAYLYGALEPSGHDHDVIAHALNERFVEMGGNHPVPYVEDQAVEDPAVERRRDDADHDAEAPDLIRDFRTSIPPGRDILKNPPGRPTQPGLG